MAGSRLGSNTVDGYYDHSPLLRLDRHLVLAGLLADDTRAVGYRLAALTGLPFADLDRKIEHRAGKSIWELIWGEGEARYRELEQELLRRELRATPCGVLVLGDGTLIDPANRAAVLEESRSILLDLDLANCYWRLQKQEAAQRPDWHPLYSGPLEGVQTLRPFYQRRQPGLAELPERIDARGRGLMQIVDELQRMIGADRH